MWPLDAPGNSEFVRIGRIAVERWVNVGDGLSLLASCLLPSDALDQPECLGSALGELYSERPNAKAKLNLLLESAWSPLLLADTGGALWGRSQVTNLIRHRLGSLHANPHSNIADWDVRVDHCAGDRFALGYAVPARVKSSLQASAAQAGLRLASLQPALAWSSQRLQPARRWPGKTGWWVWPEQDRLLVVRIQAGRPVVVNAAAPLGDTHLAIEQIVKVEAARHGIDSSRDPIGIGAWKSSAHLPADSVQSAWRTPVSRVQPGQAVPSGPHHVQAVKVSA